MKKTSIKKTIENKIIKKDNIQNIWDILKREYEDSQDQKDDSEFKIKRQTLELKIAFADNITYESETDDLLQNGNIIDLKKCTTINIEYYNYELERRITVDLSNSKYGRSEIFVKGDKNWTSGTFSSLTDIVESMQPQQHWFIKYKCIILIIATILIAFTFYRLGNLVFANKYETNSKHSFGFLFTLFWTGLPLSWIARDYILDLWPNIEFDFGPEHKKIEKIRRQKIGIFFSAILLPLILTFIYETFIYELIKANVG